MPVCLSLLLLLPSLLSLAEADRTRPSPHRRRLLQSPALPNSTVPEGGAVPSPGPETLPVDTVQRDCIIFWNRYYDVAAIPGAEELVVPTQNVQPLAETCCTSCHNNPRCNVWQWCPQSEGCTIPGVDVLFPHQGCQLLHIGGFSPYDMGNLTAITGTGVPFTAGGAVEISVPNAPGYEVVVGADFGGKFDYPCAQSALEGRCMLYLPLQDIVDRCTADPLCLAFVYFPQGIDFQGAPVGLLKGGSTVVPVSRANAQLNPSAAVYYKTTTGAPSRGSGGGNEDSTIVVAVVASLGGVLLLVAAVAAGLYLKVYHPRRLLAEARTAGTGEKPSEEQGEGSPGTHTPGGHSQGSSSATASDGTSPSVVAALEAPQERVQRKDWQPQLMRRTNSPPSVVDAHLEGVLGCSGAELHAPANWPDGSPSVQLRPTEGGGAGEDFSSPFMQLDEATIAAMMAAAPSMATLAPSAPAACSASTRDGSQVQALRSGSSVRPLHSGSSSDSSAITVGSWAPLQQQPVQQGTQGWEDVIVEEVAGVHPSELSSPPPSMPSSSTARELLDAFAKLYRQRPKVDYSTLSGMVGDEEGGEGGGSTRIRSDSLSPQAMLDVPGTNAAWPQQPQQQPQRQQQQQADSAVGWGPFNGSSSVSLMNWPQQPLPWSDWALKPEEVEVCRRPDGSWWQLGSGACGTVYKGLYHGVQPVAVKVLHQQEEDARQAHIFMREVTMLKGLRDRNIVQFLGASLEGANAMMVTEFMEFGDLWRALPLKKQSGERVFGWYRRGRRVALDVARGLHYLHSRKVVHLDLKSANILLSRHGNAKVADVGMARVMNRDYLTMLSGLGTFAWSAPEVLAGKRCSEKVDIYSFGVVLWEICTGEVPVRGDMRLLQAPQDCPQEVADLHARCTAEDPQARPTARNIVDILMALPAS